MLFERRPHVCLRKYVNNTEFPCGGLTFSHDCGVRQSRDYTPLEKHWAFCALISTQNKWINILWLCNITVATTEGEPGVILGSDIKNCQICTKTTQNNLNLDSLLKLKSKTRLSMCYDFLFYT